MREETEAQASETLTQRLAQVHQMIQAGRYEGASSTCDELIERYPDSAEAHAAQGDVCGARQMWARAAEWYELALQLGAGNDVRRRLERARQHLESAVGETTNGPPQFPVQRQRTRLWWIFGGAGAAILLAIAIVLIALLSPPTPGTSRSQQKSRPYPAPPIPEPPVPSTSPVVHTPLSPPLPTRPQPRPTTPSPSSAAAPQAAPHAPVIITRQMIGPVSDRDYHIARTLGSLTWPDGTPLSDAVAVMMEPYTGYAMITFEIPQVLEGEELFEAVVRQSYSLAATALRTDAGIHWLTIRALATITTPDKEERTVVAYRANTRRGTLEYWMKLREEPTAEQLWEEVFATSWWNPSLPQDRIR